jgi:hypothetical protein
MSEPPLIDPQIFQYHFFMRKHSREKRQQEEAHWKEFKQAVEGDKQAVEGDKGALKWAGDTLSKSVYPETWGSRHGYTHRWVSSYYQAASDGTLRQMDARTLLDCYYILTGCALKGCFSPDEFANLKKALWEYTGEKHAFLGDAVCLTAEIPPDTRPEQLKDLMRKSVCAWGEKPDEGSILLTHFGAMYVPAEPDRRGWALFTWQEEQAMKERDHLGYRVMPSLLLAWLKSWHIVSQFDVFQVQAEEQESLLDAELKEYAERPCRLKTLESQSDRIAKCLIQFAETLSTVDELLLTLQTNVDNLERLLHHELAPHMPPESVYRLQTILIAPIQTQVEQIRTDLHYFNITRDQADRTLNGIDTQTGIMSARWERGVTIFLALFAGAEIAQLLPQEWSFFEKGAVAVGVAMVIAMMVKGSDLWQWISEKGNNRRRS